MWYIFHVDLANRLQMPVWKGEGPSKPSQTNNLEGDWTNIFPTFWFSSHQISSKPACGERGTVPFSAGVVTWCESGCSCVHLIKLLPKKVSSRVKKQKHLFHRAKPFSLSSLNEEMLSISQKCSILAIRWFQALGCYFCLGHNLSPTASTDFFLKNAD